MCSVSSELLRAFLLSLVLIPQATWAAQPINAELVGSWPGFARGECQDVSILGDRAYAAIGVQGVAILDVSDPADIQPLGSFSLPGRATGVQVVGNLAYVSDGVAGLQVLDISDPAGIKLLGGFGSDGFAWSVQVIDNRAYVANDTGGVLVLDVSDPARIQLLGKFGTGAQRVYVMANLAYVAGGAVDILDISDVSHIRRLGGINIPATDVQVTNHLAYVTSGTSSPTVHVTGFRVFDVSDPANPKQLGTLDDQAAVLRVEVVGPLAYLAMASSGLRVVDVSDPANLRVLADFHTFGSANGLTIAGSRVYLADGILGLQVLDVADPANVRRVGRIGISGDAQGIQVSGGQAYVADGWAGLQILDVSNPAKVRRVGDFDTRGIVLKSTTKAFARSVSVTGRLACVANSYPALLLVDISNPAQARLAGSFDTSGSSMAVHVLGNTAYVANTEAEAALEIFNVSDPAQPQRLGGYKSFLRPIQYAKTVQVQGNLAYLLESDLTVLDVGNPTSIGVVGTLYTGAPTDCDVVDKRAYVVGSGTHWATEPWDSQPGLEVLDVSNPAQMQRLGSIATGRSPQAVQVAGGLAFVAEGSGAAGPTVGVTSGLRIFDLRDAANLQEVGLFTTSQSVNDVQVIGDLAFLAAGPSGLVVLRLSGGPGFAPGIVAGPVEPQAQIDGQARFQVMAAGTEPLRYQWRKGSIDLSDDGHFSGATTAALTINHVEPSDLGSYWVQVSNPIGMATSAPALLNPRGLQLSLARSEVQPADGKLVLRLLGAQAGDTVAISTSSDLRNWVLLSTNLVSSGASAVDVPWFQTEQRFYRASTGRAQ